MRHDNQWYFPAGTIARDGWRAVVDEGIEGWRHTGIRVAELAPGAELSLPAGDVERIVVPLAGSFGVRVSEADDTGRTFELAGRRSVFDGPSDVLYVGAGGALMIIGRDTERDPWRDRGDRAAAPAGRVAVAEAPASARKPTRYIARDEVPIELRGAGRSSRQVHNFGTPAALDAQKLIVCEVITPAENWSSYPAHKHDEHVPGVESKLEEIYYFEAAVARGTVASSTVASSTVASSTVAQAGPAQAVPAAADPFGMFATYSSPAGEISTAALVRTGDIALVPFGYHGPAAAAPGYDLYYLNVMAGPGDERVWNITDDPAHAWVRGTWDGQQIDPRLPYTASADATREDAPR